MGHGAESMGQRAESMGHGAESMGQRKRSTQAFILLGVKQRVLSLI